MTICPQISIKAITNSYKNLASKVALRPIHNHRAYKKVQRTVDLLAIQPKLTKDQADYLEMLTLLMEKYEAEHFEIDTSGVSPIEALKYLMEQNGLSGSDLGRILGQRQLGSKILNGKQDLSKAHIKRLAEYFNVDGGLFL